MYYNTFIISKWNYLGELMIRSKKSATSILFFFLFLIILLIFKPASAQIQNQDETHQVNIYFFWGDGCPHCATEKPFLETLVEQYPQVKLQTFEVYYEEENQELFIEFGKVLGFEPQGVPTTIIGKQYWIGFRDEYKSEIEMAVYACILNQCEFDPGKEIFGNTSDNINKKPSEHLIQIPVLGTVDLENQNLLISTAIIGFVDGFNPCSLWVLSVLLAITLHSDSRKKILIVGLTFLLTTTIVYSLFISGVFTIFSYVGYLKWIQLFVAAIAMVFGVINLKDYFWYKEGISFTISDRHKPKMYKNMRSTVTNPRTILGLISSTSVLAVGISLIEFACTAGFPVIWSNLLVTNNVSTWTFLLLLGLYMLIYLVDELVIFGAAVITMKASKIEEKHGRLLKLMSGMIIFVLGLVMVVNPDLMNQISSSLLVFSFAIITAMIVYFIHQQILPKFGIYIGTGFDRNKFKKHK